MLPVVCFTRCFAARWRCTRRWKASRVSRTLRASRVSRAVAVASALIAQVLAAPLVAAAAEPRAGDTSWTRPVDGEIVATFEAPRSVYGPGHRGVDFAARPGTPVRAAGDGVVSFAGSVAGSVHVVIAHRGGLRTSYSFLALPAVRTGERVERGQVIGTTGGAGDRHSVGSMHFGARLGEQYIDPMRLLGPVDLRLMVRLTPVRGAVRLPPPSAERRELRVSLSLGATPAWARDALGLAGDSSVLDVLVGAFTGAGKMTVDGVRSLYDATVTLASFGVSLTAQFAELAVKAWSNTPRAVLLAALARYSESLVTWLATWRACTDDPPELDGSGGSGHLVMGDFRHQQLVEGEATDAQRAIRQARVPPRRGVLVFLCRRKPTIWQSRYLERVDDIS